MNDVLTETPQAHVTLYLVPQRTDRLAAARRRAAPWVSSAPHERTLVLRGLHPDVIELTSSGNKDRIGIDQVRELIHQAQFTPVQGLRKVCIIPEAEALTVEAANALLKVLEEPPRGLTFVLLAGHASDLLPTIVSRSRIIRVPPESGRETERRLREAGYEAQDASWLSSIATRDGEFERLIERPLDVDRSWSEAVRACRLADAVDLIGAACAADPLMRRAGMLGLVSRLQQADVDLLTTGVRFLAAQGRAEIVLFMGDLLAACSAVIRAASSAGPPAARDEQISIAPEPLVGVCRAIETAYRAVLTYGPTEGILFSLFDAFRGGEDDG